MHSWRGQLTDGEMQDVVAYVRFLSQQGRSALLSEHRIIDMTGATP